MKKRQLSCQSLQQHMQAYSDGSLTLADRDLFDAHLAHCPSCSRRVQQQQNFNTKMRFALQQSANQQSLSPQREAEIRAYLSSIKPNSRRDLLSWVNINSFVTSIAALLLVGIVTTATFWPSAPPSARSNRPFISYSSGQQHNGTTVSTLRGQAITIRFADATLPAEHYEGLVQSFQAANSDVTVQVSHPSRDQHNAGLLATNNTCFVAPADIYQEQLYKTLQPLTRYALADANINTNDFFPSLLDNVRLNDQLYGIPRSVDLRLLYYNTKLLEEADIPIPKDRWTIEEFSQIVQAVSKERDVPSFMAYDGNDILHLLSQQGIPRPKLDQPQFTNAQTIAALDWYYDLALSDDIVTYSLYDPEREQMMQDLLSRQELAIWTGKPMASHQLSSRFGVKALPYQLGQATVMQSDAYFISANSNHQQAGACWRWIRYLSLQRTDSEQIPARLSLLSSDAFVSQYGQRQTDAIIEGLSSSSLNEPWLPSHAHGIFLLLDEVLLEHKPLYEGLLRLQQELSTGNDS
jgi:ABC-type glycerol-3-phosphate transport system substrate-binding protein